MKWLIKTFFLLNTNFLNNRHLCIGQVFSRQKHEENKKLEHALFTYPYTINSILKHNQTK